MQLEVAALLVYSHDCTPQCWSAVSHCYGNASVFCAYFPVLICLASAFNTDSSSDLVNEIKTF